MTHRIVVVHTDAVVRADLIDALHAARPSAFTLSFADLESLAAHLQGTDLVDLLLFDAQFRFPEHLLSMFRWAVPLVFNPTAADAVLDASGLSRNPLPIPFRDEALSALLDGLFDGEEPVTI